MADNSSGGIGILGVIIGAVIVVAVALFLFGGNIGGTGGPDKNVSINAEPPRNPATNQTN